jgi:2-amino-4-hydroxy-6-hydroxymethyldihydropteridine diphosphokinase
LNPKSKIKNEKSKSHQALIALGSNLGQREKYVAAALNALQTTKEVEVAKVSSLYETEPVGGPSGQQKYINAVAMIRTSLSAPRLLKVCQRIEDSFERKRSVKYGPRTIDLDILAFDKAIISEPKLMIPHPLMHERRFVMEPLAEIAPNWIHPLLEMSAKQLLADMGTTGTTGMD